MEGQKSATIRRKGWSRSRSSSLRGSIDSSIDAGDDDPFGIKDSTNLYYTVANYIPNDSHLLPLEEGVFVEILDSGHADVWKVRCAGDGRVGLFPVVYLRRSLLSKIKRDTREVFREDIIQITNKKQEAMVKKRYTLTELVETEREYCRDLKRAVEGLHSFSNRSSLNADLKRLVLKAYEMVSELYVFHEQSFLESLQSCIPDHVVIGKCFLNQTDQFLKYSYLLEVRERIIHHRNLSKESTDGLFSLLELLERPRKRLRSYFTLLQDLVKYSTRTRSEMCVELDKTLHMLGNIRRRHAEFAAIRNTENLPKKPEDLQPLFRLSLISSPEDRILGLLSHENLLLCTTDEDNMPQKFMKHIKLSEVRIRTISGDRSYFELWRGNGECSEDIMGFLCPSEFIASGWISDIKHIMRYELGIAETEVSPHLIQGSRRGRSGLVTLIGRQSGVSDSLVSQSSDANLKSKKSNSNFETPTARMEVDSTPDTSYRSAMSAVSEEYQSVGSRPGAETGTGSSYHTATDKTFGKGLFIRALRPQICNVGDTITFECEIDPSNAHKATAEWSYEGIVLSAERCDDRIRWRHSPNGKFSLTISKSMEGDEGMYSIRVELPDGESSSCQASLSVTNINARPTSMSTLDEITSFYSEEAVDVSLGVGAPPNVCSHLELINTRSPVVVGSTIHLECSIIAKGSTYNWYLNDDLITIRDSARYAQSVSEDRQRLTVKSVTASDAGDYRLRVTNPLGFAETSLNVKINDSADHLGPRLSSEITSLDLEEGQTFRIPIYAESSEPFTVLWFRDDQILPQDDRRRASKEGNRCELRVESITEDDAGEYTCIAESRRGQESLTVPVKIRPVKMSRRRGTRSGLKTLPAPRKVDSSEDEEPIGPPKLHCDIESLDLVSGETSTISVFLETLDESARTTWKKDGNVIGSGDDGLTFSFDGRCAYLTIINAVRNDAGLYECIVFNEEGEDRVKIPVTVRRSREFSAKVARRMSLRCDVTELSFIEGSTAKISIEIMDEPSTGTVSITWLKNDEKLNIENDQRMSQETRGTQRILIIENLRKSDEATYTCKVTAGDGTEMSREIDLRIQPKLKSLNRKSLEHFDEVKEVTVESGRRLTLSANLPVEGSDCENYRWTYNGQPIDEIKLLRNTSVADGRNLIIKKTSSDHAGRYVCQCSNKKTKATSVAEIELYVVPATTTPSELISDDKKVDLEEGQTFTLTVTANEPLDDDENIQWTCNDKSIDISDPRIHVSHSGTKITLRIQNAKLSDGGIYGCHWENFANDIAISVNVRPGKPKEKLIPKKIELVEGQSVNLSITATNLGDAKVTWKLNGRILDMRTNKRLKLSRDGDRLGLILEKSTIHDAGELTCDIDGRDSVPFLVSIQQKKKEPPKVIEIIEGRTFSVSVTASNLKEAVTWTLNGSSIDPNIDKRFKLSRDGDNLGLTLSRVTLYDKGTLNCLVGERDPVSFLLNVQPKEKVDPKKIQLKEGQTASASVAASNLGDAKVDWTLNNKRLDANDKRFRVTRDNDRLEITIERVTLKDAGLLACNIEDRDPVEFLLQIQEKEKTEPKLVELIEGQSVDVFVTATNLGDERICWTLNNQTINPTNEKRVTASKDGDRIRLLINSATMDDNGLLCCNIDGRNPVEFLVKVHPKERKEAQVIELMEGQTVDVSVTATNIGDADYRWKLNDQLIRSDKDKRVHIFKDGEKLELRIERATTDDEGELKCEVDGRDPVVMILCIKSKTAEKDKKPNLEDGTEMEPLPDLKSTEPQKAIKPDDTNNEEEILPDKTKQVQAPKLQDAVKEEGNVPEKTELVEAPKPKEVAKEEEIAPDKTKPVETPKPKEAAKEEEIAPDNTKPVETPKPKEAAKEEEIAPDQAKPVETPKPIEAAKEEESAPEKTKPVKTPAVSFDDKKIDVVEGETINLSVSVKDKGEFVPVWKHNGNIIDPSKDNRMRISSNDDKLCLSIEKATQKDSGTLSCEIGGSEPVSIPVNVKVDDAKGKEKSLPKLDKLIQDVEEIDLKEGEQIDVQIIAKNIGMKKPFWKHNGKLIQPLKEKRAKITKFGDRLKLSLKNVTMADAGEISCEVEGREPAVIQVKVRSKDLKDAEPKDNDTDNETSVVPEKTEPVEAPKPKEAAKEEEIAPDNTKPVETPKPKEAEKEEEIAPDQAKPVETPKPIEAAKEEESAPEKTKPVKTPAVSFDDKKVDVVEGETINLSVSVKDKGEFVPVWKHNGSIIDPSKDNRMRISSNDDKLCLSIEKATQKDSGTLSCEIGGSEPVSIPVNVKVDDAKGKEKSLPKLDKLIQDVEEIDLKEGEQIDVQIIAKNIGMKKPFWKHNGKLIQPLKEKRAKITKFGDRLKLSLKNVTMADAGEISCEVEGREPAVIQVKVRSKDLKDAEPKDNDTDNETSVVPEKTEPVEAPKPKEAAKEEEIAPDNTKPVETPKPKEAEKEEEIAPDQAKPVETPKPIEAAKEEESAPEKTKPVKTPAVSFDDKKVDVVEGETINLSVSVKDKGEFVPVWKHNGNIIDPSKDNRMRISSNDDKLCLSIEKATQKDSGTLSCEIGGSEPVSIPVNVKVDDAKGKEKSLPKLDKLIQDVEEIDLKEGEQIDVQIIAKNIGMKKPFWKHNGKLIQPLKEKRAKITKFGDRLKLSLKNVTMADAGEISCEVEGREPAVIQVKVRSKDLKDAEPKDNDTDNETSVVPEKTEPVEAPKPKEAAKEEEIAPDNTKPVETPKPKEAEKEEEIAPDQAKPVETPKPIEAAKEEESAPEKTKPVKTPAVSFDDKKIDVVEGETINLSVSVKDKGEFVPVWKHNGNIIDPSKDNRMRISSNDDKLCLSIEKATQKDSGTLSCEIGGSEPVSIPVNVKVNDAKGKEKSLPKLDKLIQDVEEIDLKEGEQIDVQIIAKNIGMKKPFWKHNGKLIQPLKEKRAKITKFGDRLKLSLKNVTMADAGEISCEVEGREPAVIQVKVRSKDLKDAEPKDNDTDNETSVVPEKTEPVEAPKPKEAAKEEEIAPDNTKPVETPKPKEAEKEEEIAPDQAKPVETPKPIEAAKEEESAPEKTKPVKTPAVSFDDKKIDVVEGETINLSVSVKDKGEFVPVWKHNGNIIDPSKDNRMRISSNDDKLCLSIEKATQKDSGTLSCEIGGSEPVSIPVNVKVDDAKGKEKSLPKLDKLIQDVEEIDLKEGEQIDVQIIAKNIGMKKPFWKHNGKLIQPLKEKRAKITKFGDRLKLSLKNVTMADAGEISCEVEGREPAVIQVKVRSKDLKDAEPKDTIKSDVTDQTEDRGQLIQETEKLDLVEGETIVADVAAKNLGKVKPIWKLNGKLINPKTDDRVKITNNGDRHTLTISDATANDAGELTCEVGNKTAATIPVKIRRKKTKTSPKLDSAGDNLDTTGKDVREDEKFYSISLDCDTEKVELQEGQAVELRVRVKADEKFKARDVKWKVGDKVLVPTDDDRVSIVFDGHTVHFRLRDVISTDSGLYECHIDDKQALTPASITIPVKVVPSLTKTADLSPDDPPSDRSLKRASVDKGTSSLPVLRCDVEDVDIDEGQTINIAVLYKSPAGDCDVIWRHDDKVVQTDEDDRVLITKTKDRCFLQVKRSTVDDCGNYACDLVTPDGSARVIVPVTVRKPEERQNTGANAIIIEEEEGDDEIPGEDANKEIPSSDVETLTLKSEKDMIELKEGSPIYLVVNCQSKSGPVKMRWFYGDEPLESSEGTGIVIGQEDEERFYLKISYAMAEDSGDYICIASDQKSEQKVVIGVRVKVPSSTPAPEAGGQSDANIPVLKCDLESIEVDTNETIDIVVEVDCRHPPTPSELKWSCGNRALDSRKDSRIQISQEGGQCRLKLLRAAMKDSGLYSLSLENSQGSAKVEVPVFVRPDTKASLRSEAQEVEVTEGDDAEISVAIQSPDIVLPSQIKWTRNDKSLLGERKRIKSILKKDKVALRIENASSVDTGTYRCVLTKDGKTVDAEIELKVIPKVAPTSPKNDSVESPDPEIRCEIEEIDLKEGEALEICCSVHPEDFSDTKAIKWLRSGRQLTSLDDKRVSQSSGNNGKLFLKISDIRREDAGNYSCIITRASGKKISSENISVRVRSAPQQEKTREPLLKCDVMKLDVESGEAIRIPVKIENVNKTPIITWKRGGQLLLDTMDDRLSLSGDSCGAVFELKDVTVDDAGCYVCTVRDRESGRTCTESIDVNVRPSQLSVPSTKPEVKVPKLCCDQKEFSLSEGDCLNLDAYITSENKDAEIEWRKDGAKIEDDPDNGIKVEVKPNKHFSLFIDDVMEEDGGIYTCTARNAAGSTTASFQVSVRASGGCTERPALARLSSYDDEEELRPSTPPRLTSDLLSIDCEEHETARLVVRCTHELTDEQEVRWFRDGVALTSGPSVHVDLEGHAATLTMTNISLEDGGVYRCCVQDSGGQASIEIPVYVRPKKSSRAVKHARGELDPPRLMCDVEEIDLIEGQTLDISARYRKRSASPLDVFWAFRGETLRADENEGISIRSEIDGTSLQIVECTLADAGVYTCHAKNADGTSEIKVPVRVRKRSDNPPAEAIIKRPKLPVPTIEAPPSIETDVDMLEAEIGHTVQLSMECRGADFVQWCRNGMEISAFEDPRITMSKTGSHLQLSIENANFDDVGEYMCIVSNQYGENCAKVLLCVRAPADSSDVSRSEDLSYPPMLFCDKAVYTVSEGNPITLEVIYEGKPVPQIQWFFDEEPIESQVVKNMTTVAIHSTTMSDKGKYLCTASNEFGEKSMLIVLKVIPNNDRPMIVAPPRNVQARMGRIVKLECQVKGAQPMTGEWFHRGQLIEGNNPNYVPWSHGDYFALTLPAVSFNEEGDYTLFVSNDFGEARVSAFVTIKETGIMSETGTDFSEHNGHITSAGLVPVITKKLRDINVGEGEPVRFLCRVMAEPEPEIRWFKDDDPLISIPPYRIRIVGGVTSLEIEEAMAEDRGYYTCLVQNALGEARSTGKLSIDGYPDLDDSLSEDSDTGSVIIDPRLIQDRVPPRFSPRTHLDSVTVDSVDLSWTIPVSDSSYTFIVETSHDGGYWWKPILSDIDAFRVSLPNTLISPLKHCSLRVMAANQHGSGPPSTPPLLVPLRAATPHLPPRRPVIITEDATCIIIQWDSATIPQLEERFHDPVSLQTVYELQYRESHLGEWRTLANRTTETSFPFSCTPGVAYMFRVRASNVYGTSDFTPASVHRVDPQRLAPELGLDPPPWAHILSETSINLEWKPAYLADYCHSCAPAMEPKYEVECRKGRLGRWTPLASDLEACELRIHHLDPDEQVEFRVSCRNRYGASGPTKPYRLQRYDISRRKRNISDQGGRSSIAKHIATVPDSDRLAAEVVSVGSDGVEFRWVAFTDKTEFVEHRRYCIERRDPVTWNWETVAGMVYGEDFCLDEMPNVSEEKLYRILSITSNGLVDAHQRISLGSRDLYRPGRPVDLRVTVEADGSHKLSWSPPACHPHVTELPLTYSVDFQTSDNASGLWRSLANVLMDTTTVNRLVRPNLDYHYRVIAKNCIGEGESVVYEYVRTKSAFQIEDRWIDGVRFMIVSPSTLRISWRLADDVFNTGMVEEARYLVERRTLKGEWKQVSDELTDLNFHYHYFDVTDENWFRVVPLMHGISGLPSRATRVNIKLCDLLPDLSSVKPSIDTTELENYVISWQLPDFDQMFTVAIEQLTTVDVLLRDMSFTIEAFIDGAWEILDSGVADYSFTWQGADPTEQFFVRLSAHNDFGTGIVSRAAEILEQVVIPDMSFVRPQIKTISKTSIDLSWYLPRGALLPRHYTPCSFEVQWLDPSGEWIPWISDIRKTRITIPDIDPSRDYVLRILPSNDYGVGQPSQSVNKYGRRGSTSSCTGSVMSSRRSSVQSIISPSISEAGENLVYALIDQQFVLTCTIPGDQPTEVIWLKDGQSAFETDGVIECTDLDGNHCIRIDRFSEYDVGIYTAFAILECSQVRREYRVELADSPTILEPPPANSRVIHHGTLRLSCRVHGSPNPQVTWLKDWRPVVTSHRTRVREDEDGLSSMVIDKMMVSDAGVYSVSVENVAGKVLFNAKVEVDDDPKRSYLLFSKTNIYDFYHILGEKESSTAGIEVRRVISKLTGAEGIARIHCRQDTRVRQRLRRELQCLNSLTHPNIVQALDAYESPRSMSIIFKRAEGLPLLQYLSTTMEWTESRAAELCQALVEILIDLHSNRVVHLGLKPENIIVSEANVPYLTDMSTAQMIDKGLQTTTFESEHFDEYSAPELYDKNGNLSDGARITFSADCWSMGIITYLILSGTHPFVDENGQLEIERLLNAEVEFDHDYFQNVSESAIDFITHLLQKEINQRLSAMEMNNHPWIDADGSKNGGTVIKLERLSSYIEEYQQRQTAIQRDGRVWSEEDEDDDMDLSSSSSTISLVAPPSQPPDTDWKDDLPLANGEGKYKTGEGTILIPRRDSSFSIRLRQYRRFSEQWSLESKGEVMDRIADEPEDHSDTLVDDFSAPSASADGRELVPVFREVLEDTGFEPGRPVSMRCQVAKLRGAACVSWYRNDELITDGDRLQLDATSDGVLTLTFRSTLISDEGVYKCLVRTRETRAMTTARLFAGTEPEQPGRPAVVDFSSNSVLLLWNASNDQFCGTTYRVDVLRTDLKHSQWQRWIYTQANTALIEDLHSACGYMFRVVAQNRFGVSPYSIASVKVRTKYKGTSRLDLLSQWRRSFGRIQKFNLEDIVGLPTVQKKLDSEYPPELKVVERISEGQYASVDLCKMATNDLHVVVKRCLVNADSPHYEHQCLSELGTSNFTPQLVGNFLSQSRNCLLMSYIPGVTLLRSLCHLSSYSEFTVAQLIRQILLGLTFIHRYGFLHLNIHPENLIVEWAYSGSCRVRIVGFSKARHLSFLDGGQFPSDVNPDFSAPELSGDTSMLTYATDLWSVGAVAYLLLTGNVKVHRKRQKDIQDHSNVEGPEDNDKPKEIQSVREGENRSIDLSHYARRFIHCTLNQSASDRGDISGWLQDTWFSLKSSETKGLSERVISSEYIRKYQERIWNRSDSS